MWIFLSDAMLSIVQKRGERLLTVRSRRKGDIESVFPDAAVTADAGTDYKYRARIPRKKVAEVISQQIMNLDYDNFKSSVEDNDRHDAYMNVWSAMMRYQNKVEGHRQNKRQSSMEFGTRAVRY